MSELKERLREVDQIPVSDLWDDIRSRPPRPELKVKGGHRGAIVIGALLLAAAALSFLVRAFLGPERPMSSASASFYIKLPSGPLGWDARGRAVLDAQTNLPAATIVQLYFFSADAEGPGMARVANGRLPIGVSNTLCHQTEVGLVGTDVRVEASVLPEYPAGSASGPLYGPRPAPPPLKQPPSVQAVLGAHFERLVGDQVRLQYGQRTLFALRTYELAADHCSAKVEYVGGGSFREVPISKPVPVPSGPFPKPPFHWCPDAEGALPVEASLQSPNDVAIRFDVALTNHDTATLRHLADPSVRSLSAGWRPTGLADPSAVNAVPSGEYLPAVPTGCGALVAIRTVGVQVAAVDHPQPSVTYLLILRRDGWKVWGWVPGDGR